MNASENAKHLSATVGRDQFWTVQQDADGAYISADRSRPLKGRYMVTDDAAIRMARAAGVQCDDEGRIA